MLKLQEGQFVKITGAEVKNDNDIYIVECDYSIEEKYATCHDEYCLEKVKLNGELSKSKYTIFFYSEYAIKENPNLKIEIITDLKKAKKEVNAYLKSRENNEVVTSYKKAENQTITIEKVFIRFIKPLTFGTWGTKYIRKDSIFQAYLREDNCLVIHRVGKQGQLLSLLDSSNGYSFNEKLTERTITEYIEIVEKVETKKGDIATEVKSIETIAETPIVKEESKKSIETIEEDKEETTQEIKNNINVAVNFNTDKNGIELSFTDKPSEDIRQQLKANGFRWAKYNKVWYVKDSEDKREFLKAIGFLTNEGGTTTITEESKSVEYPTININDIESYTIDAEISKRENDNSMFRRNDTNHQNELQELLQSANDDITELLKMECDNYMEFKAKTYLQSFKKKYYELYKRILNHKANNVSWMVSGRGNLNVSRYNKKQEQLTNMYKQSSELIDNFNDKIESFKDKLAREKEQAFKKQMDNNLNSIKEIPKFTKVKIKINGDATRENIFNVDNIRFVREVNAYQLEGYSVINNWGAWKVYNAEGKEIYSAKSKGTLKDAQKYVLYIISQKISA